jgi:hypothetical protein
MNKVTKVQLFKDWNQERTRNEVDWEVKEHLKKSMVHTIQQMQVTNPLMEVPFTTKGEWNTT